LKTSEVSGFAAEMACERKHSKYSSIISSNYIFKGLAFETLDPWCKESIDFINVIGNRNQATQNQRNPFSREFPLLFNVETQYKHSGHFSSFCFVNQKCYVQSMDK
jgi:hypothetical protein